jgi:hypothetical protein
MARQFSAASSQYGSVVIDLTPYNKLSLSFWMWWDAFANDDKMALEFTANAGSNDGSFSVLPNESTTGRFWWWGRNNSGVFTDFQFTRPSAAAWHHYCLTFDNTLSTNEMAGYVDGAVPSGVTRTLNGNTSGVFANSTLYVMSRATSSLFGNGRLSMITLYPGTILTMADAEMLAAGYHPSMVRRDAITRLWELDKGYSPEPDHYGGTHITLGNSPTQVDDPPIIYPPEVLHVVQGGAAPPATTSPFFFSNFIRNRRRTA